MKSLNRLINHGDCLPESFFLGKITKMLIFKPTVKARTYFYLQPKHPNKSLIFWNVRKINECLRRNKGTDVSALRKHLLLKNIFIFMIMQELKDHGRSTLLSTECSKNSIFIVDFRNPLIRAICH